MKKALILNYDELGITNILVSDYLIEIRYKRGYKYYYSYCKYLYIVINNCFYKLKRFENNHGSILFNYEKLIENMNIGNKLFIH